MSLPHTGVAQNSDLAKVQAAAVLARFRPGSGQIAHQTPSGVVARPVSGFRGQPFRRGRAAPIVRALTLTLSAPPGWERPEGQEGTPVFVTPGTAGGIMPDPSLFTTALGYIQSVGIRYVWAKIGVSPMAPLFATSLEFVTDTTSGAYTTGPFGSDGTPPEFVYVPLGYVSASGSPLVVHPPVNFGAGSIVVAMHIGDVTATETGLVQNFSRHLSYWRTDTDA